MTSNGRDAQTKAISVALGVIQWNQHSDQRETKGTRVKQHFEAKRGANRSDPSLFRRVGAAEAINVCITGHTSPNQHFCCYYIPATRHCCASVLIWIFYKTSNYCAAVNFMTLSTFSLIYWTLISDFCLTVLSDDISSAGHVHCTTEPVVCAFPCCSLDTVVVQEASHTPTRAPRGRRPDLALLWTKSPFNHFTVKKSIDTQELSIAKPSTQSCWCNIWRAL